ncbi:M23 family metallopeptidase [Paraferrimonas sedimenticola]|uniref:Peptidase M23 n=1 Tax=Paraferrimonas sedimenticola TaxID=375674 RepID=A0AA37RXW0_9GAMM|nr:M23 family metallopeptidase [Paraferrimonas sedimenticola]GLP97491.1 peptidase M23 [Paraferrimonas sedimenticola]
MSVTVFIQRRKGVLRWQPGKAWLLLPVALIAATAYLSIHQSETQAEQLLAEERESHQTDLSLEEVAELKKATKAQLQMLATKVASIQARLARMEALGEQVAEKARLADQFDFSGEVGVGGEELSEQPIELQELMLQMDQLMGRLQKNDDELALLGVVTHNHHVDEQRYITGRPIKKGWMSSPYGIRNDPFSGRKAMHKGMDFAGSEGEAVIATGAGVVTWAETLFGYGEMVEIDHGNGLKTRYGHNKEILVKVGDVVAKGQEIALMGSTGRSTGPHVHYEVLRSGKQVDPNNYVYRKPRV